MQVMFDNVLRENGMSTIVDKHDKFITGFEHSCSLQQAEAVVKTTLQVSYTNHVLDKIMFMA